MKKIFPSDRFAELYSAYYKKSFLFTKSYVHDKYVAEDIASEALMKLYEKLQKEEIESIPAYLLTLLKNQSLDYLRKKAVRDKAHADYSTADYEELNYRISTLQECDPSLIFSKEIQSIIDATLAQLSPQTRKIFILSRYENYSNKEIAAELNISVKSVEYHITKALNLFRENLKDYLPLFYFLFLF
ncbi:RNA polymerase sigma-70 factor [Proteiniphilum saccharofermentans]|uniref:RNA polymerase sigma-70 factor n=1 Tax=Proteiniphilum saccharofermentans TaxID=1642647 RepID=A0A1R3TCG0_9BACT|nr:RNA polymerase sigma-70 factor [Proteiniphilum saccharofermentans]SCD21284.1 RNA polymerase sigma-70 factor [Proteiniphilum saccharofermentans]SFS93768.1 RNA polymerase sigma-70 factor, ECF subfamily [Porphyromonadaceae bacterium NLAE-zl-C104]